MIDNEYRFTAMIKSVEENTMLRLENKVTGGNDNAGEDISLVTYL